MAKKTIKAQMKQRRDTKANWASTNPVLLDGELGIVSDDPNLYKVGDGTTAWNALPFRGFDGTLAQELGTSPNAVISQKVVSEKLAKLESEVTNIKNKVESGAGGSGDGNINIQGGGIYLLKYLEYPHISGLSEEDKANNIQIYNAVMNGTLDRPIATYKDGIYMFFSNVMDDETGSVILTSDVYIPLEIEEGTPVNKALLYTSIELKENGEAFVTSWRVEDVSDSESGNDEGTEVLTLYAFSMMWDLSPSIFEIPDGEELPEEEIELMEILLAMFANNASVYNKIMSSDVSAKSYSVVIDYMIDYINGMGCRTIVPAAVVKSFDSFRIIPSGEYKSYIELNELPDFGYTVSEDGGYSRKSSMIMFTIEDTGVLNESLVQQNAMVAKLLLSNQVNISNINIFVGGSQQFNAYADQAPLAGMNPIYILMKFLIALSPNTGRIMSYALDSGEGFNITNEIHFSVPGAIAKFNPYSSSPTFTEVVDFTKINN